MISGNLTKMAVELAEPVNYRLRLDDQKVDLNPYIGRHISLNYSGDIFCTACGRKTKKSYNQGYCFPCTQRLAECDICIVRPEKCHFDQGTCREPDWAQGHCFQPHYVYLANSSGVKVGITRATQIPTRWIDQGATQALPIFRAQSRFQVGLLEVAIKSHVSDKTDWRKMLKGNNHPVDLLAIKEELLDKSAQDIAAVQARFPGEIELLDETQITEVRYPVETFPSKVSSLNFDKTPLVEGQLQGIKGQYLILDKGVINIRKFTGYNITFAT